MYAYFSRTLQFSTETPSKTVRAVEKESESILCTYLNELVAQWLQATDSNEISTTQGMQDLCESVSLAEGNNENFFVARCCFVLGEPMHTSAIKRRTWFT